MDLGGASRASTVFGVMEEGLISSGVRNLRVPLHFGLRSQGPFRVGTGESGLVLSGGMELCLPLEYSCSPRGGTWRRGRGARSPGHAGSCTQWGAGEAVQLPLLYPRIYLAASKPGEGLTTAPLTPTPAVKNVAERPAI